MLSRLQLPYLTTAQRTALTPIDKDILYDTDLHKIFIGDGSTVGGLDISGGATAHDVLSTTHTDSLTGSVVAGDMIYGNATPKWTRLAKGTTGHFLKMGASLPAWGAHGLTYTDVGASATIHNLVDTTNHPVTGLTIGHVLTALSATTYGFTAPAGGSSHVLLSATHTDTLADTVIAGDILYGNATPKWARLAKGSDGNFLKLASGYPAWSVHGLTYTDVGAQQTHANLTSLAGLTYVSASFVKMTGANTFTLDTNTYLTAVTAHNILSATHGDTLTASCVAGDVIFANATPKWTRLPKGSDGDVLTLASGLPSWAAPGGGTTHVLLSATHTDTLADTVIAGDILIGNATPKWARLAKSTDGKALVLASGLPAWTSLASSHISDWGTYINQAVLSSSSPTFVNLTITSFASNWTNAGRTVADLGIVTTVDINGGTIDGATIGGASAGTGTFTSVTVDHIIEKTASHCIVLDNNSEATINFGIGNSQIWGTSATKTLCVGIGVAPASSPVNAIQFYASDYGVDGTGCPTFRDEESHIVKLYPVGATTDLGVVLSNLGLRVAGTAYPITTSGAITFYGGVSISTNDLTLTNVDIATSTSTGTIIAKTNLQKIGFFGTTPVAQQAAATDLGTVLSNLGFRVAGTAYPITTSGTLTLTGTLNISGGTLTLADNQISGDKVEGGTIAAITITALTLGSMSGDWTNAGRTIADLGIVTTGIYTTINATTIHTTTLLADHIGEHEASHTVVFDNNITLSAKSIITDTSTGLIIGTVGGAAGQKLGFFAATPVVQQLAATDLGTALSNLGFRIAGTAYPITTSGAVQFTGGVTITTTNLTITDKDIVLGTTTGTKIGTATSQKLAFFNSTPIIQPIATTDLGTVLSNLGLRASGTAYVVETTGICKYDHIAEMTASHTITFDNHITLAKDVRLTTAPGSDHTTSGITIQLVAAQNHAIGDVCRIDSSGQAYLAKADAIANASGICICADATVTSANTGNYMLIGTIRDDTWAWTVGGLIYLTITGTTGNTLSQTAPSAANNSVQIMGVATHADRMIFAPSLVQVERV